jgi:hypothetical protein
LRAYETWIPGSSHAGLSIKINRLPKSQKSTKSKFFIGGLLEYQIDNFQKEKTSKRESEKLEKFAPFLKNASCIKSSFVSDASYQNQESV